MRPSPPGSSVSLARQVAVQVLQRVWRDGAYAAASLQTELENARAAPRDAALATAIVYGTLRSAAAIDGVLGQHLRQPLARLDLLTQCSLRAAVFQLAELSRTPAHAVLHDAVAIVSAQRGKVLGGVVNAVLRRLAAAPPKLPHFAAPAWVQASFHRSLGETRSAAVWAACTGIPPIGVRVEQRDAVGAFDRLGMAARLATQQPRLRWQLGQLSPQALLLWHGGATANLPGLADRSCVLQEEGAQAVGLLAAAQPGERVLDACAGRGGKTSQLLAAVGDAGVVTAVDVHPAKLEVLRQQAPRSPTLQTLAIDWTVGAAGLVAASFDRIVVDAPCTGLGTVFRRPELLLRLSEGDAKRLAELQLQILRRVVPLLRPGGELVYAVCSPTREEGTEVAQSLRSTFPRLMPVARPADTGLQRLSVDADEGVRIGPWSVPGSTAPDLYQVFRWVLTE